MFINGRPLELPAGSVVLNTSDTPQKTMPGRLERLLSRPARPTDEEGNVTIRIEGVWVSIPADAYYTNDTDGRVMGGKPVQHPFRMYRRRGFVRSYER